MFQQELRDTEDAEGAAEEGSSPQDSSAEPEESCCEFCREPGGGHPDPPIHRPLQGRPHALRGCRRRLFAPCGLQQRVHSLHCTGHRRDSGAEAHPWERGSPPWDPHLGSWVQDRGAVCQSNWHLEQAAARTLSHPSFQTFFAAISTCRGFCSPSPGGRRVPQPSRGPLPMVDCSGFFYTDPAMPPGCRIYNCLSASSQEVLRSLQLNTLAPIMCTQPAASPGHRWLSGPECGAGSALPALPAGRCPAPGAAGGGQTDALDPCQ